MNTVKEGKIDITTSHSNLPSLFYDYSYTYELLK